MFAGADQGYLVTVEQLEAARTERTKVLLFVSPSNSDRSGLLPEQTREIGEWAEEHDLWIIADEIYQNLVYATGDQDDAGPSSGRHRSSRRCRRCATARSSSTESPRRTR